MNLPVGDIIGRGINLKEVDIRKLIEGFYDKGFSGYLVASLYGFDSVEEGVLLFKDGLLIAAIYEYEFYGITIFGDVALPHIFNSFAADFIVADIVSLSNQQIDLVTAFNDKAKLNKVLQKGDVGRLMVKAFSKDLAKSVLSNLVSSAEDKAEIFKKLGLAGLGE
jgi:hypothetical protein